MPDLVSLLQGMDTSIGYEAADEIIGLRQRLAESELEREDLRSQLNHIHMSMPLVDTHPAFAGDIPLYVKSVVANLQEKALAYDLDQAGITTRDAEAAELVSLRAEVAHMRSQVSRVVQVVSESVAVWLEEQSVLEEQKRKSMQYRSSKVLSEERAIALEWAAEEIRDGAHLRLQGHPTQDSHSATVGFTREEWEAMKEVGPKPDARIIPVKYIGESPGPTPQEDTKTNLLHFSNFGVEE